MILFARMMKGLVNKMFFFRSLAFLYLNFVRFILADNAFVGLEQLITNLVTIDNTDLVLVSDVSTESKVSFCNCKLQDKIVDALLYISIQYVFATTVL